MTTFEYLAVATIIIGSLATGVSLTLLSEEMRKGRERTSLIMSVMIGIAGLYILILGLMMS